MSTFTLPPLLTSQTVAVNTLLASIGEAPVDTVEGSQSSDVDIAVGALNEVSRAVQTEGWAWNRETSYTLSPDSTGEVPLPDNCLSVMLAYWSGNPGSPIPIGPRGRKLYDHENHTFIISKVVVVDMKLILEWEELPEAARQYITIRAAQLFQGRQQGARIVYEVQKDDVDRARATLEQDEDEANPYNQITGNRETLWRLYGRLLRRRI